MRGAKHILHLNKSATGAAWMCRQVRELVSLGWKISVAMPAGGLMSEKFRKVGATVYDHNFDFPASSPQKLPGLLSSFRKLVNEVQPDLIHSHFVGTTLTMRMALARRESVPRLFQVPGPLHLEHAFFRWLELQFANGYDHWMGSCLATNNIYRSCGISDKKIHLSYYGVDLDSYNLSVQGKLRSLLDIDGDAQLVGMVAYMYPPKWYLGQTRGLKGHEDFIDAFALCLAEHPDLHAVCIGGAWQGAEQYEKRVQAYALKRCGDKITFLGSRHDVPELYADLDIAVHPSHSENVGAAVESLLFAVPTVASNVGGFPDLVIEGETGHLVPPKSPVVLAQRLDSMLQNLSAEKELARRGQAQVQEMFDVRQTALRVAEAYTDILQAEY